MESGEVAVCEWSNYALACRFRAAATGVPFMPIRSMLGTDTFKESAAKTIACPFTGKPLIAVPALYPDVALIHVHESDAHGNCRIRGITVADWDLPRASKHVIVSAERVVSTDEIRREPNATVDSPRFASMPCAMSPGGRIPATWPANTFQTKRTSRRGWTPSGTQIRIAHFWTNTCMAWIVLKPIYKSAVEKLV